MLREMIRDVLTILEIIVWVWGICQMEFTKIRNRWIAGVGILIVFGLINVSFIYNEMLFPVQQSGYMIGTILLFQGSLSKKVVQYWFSVFYLEMIYLPIRALLFVISTLRKTLWVDQFQPEILSILTIFIVFAVGIQIKKHREWCIWIQRIPTRYYLLGILCSFCANGIIAITRSFSTEWDMKFRIVIEVLQTIVVLFFYVLGISFAFVNLWKEQFKRENALKDEYLKMAQKHYHELEAHMREVRSLRHDMKNHVLVLEKFLQAGKMTDAENYLQEIKVHQEWKNKPVVNVGNELVNAVLSDEIGKNKEVTFDSEGILPANMKISDFDLCTIFSNLLSNSMEACKSISDGEKKITLSIKTFQNKLLISMENTVAHKLPIEQLGRFTTKKDTKNHGYGIYNVKQTIEKYHGEIEFYQQKNWFRVEIFMSF